MIAGLKDNESRILDELAISVFKQHGASVWIFGSRARGDHQRFSDIDLLINPAAPLPQGLISRVREELEESHLPFKVDLVVLDELAESYRESVFRDRIRL